MLDFLIKWLVKARAKMHNDIYEKIEQAEQRLMSFLATRMQAQEAILKKILETRPEFIPPHQAAGVVELEKQIAELKEWHKASFSNLVTLTNSVPGPLTLMTPWSPNRKRLGLERLESGRLAFADNINCDSTKKPVFVITTPKSGTWFVEKILTDLGFCNCGISPISETMFTDLRHGEIRAKMQQYKGDHQYLPYEVQVEMTLPGQFHLGHMPAADPAFWAHKDHHFLLSCRDLRVTMISWLRFITYSDAKVLDGKIPSSEDFTSEMLYQFLDGNPNARNIGNAFQATASIKDSPNAHLVRFEEITGPTREHMRPSAESIARVTGVDLEKIYEAIEKSRGAKTMTYTGQLSTLRGLWSPETEKIFIQRGWDVINEKLGYPRKYSPELYG